MRRALILLAILAVGAAPAFASAVSVTDPSVSINSDADGVVPATGDSTVRAYACFSEAITGFDLSDIQVTNGTASTLTTPGGISCSGESYTFLVTANTTPATITVTIPAGAVTGVSSGQQNTAAAPDSWDYDASLETITTLSGKTWYDANHDGIMTASGSCSGTGGGDACAPGVEASLKDITVTATPYADASTPDDTRPTLSTTTNSTGSYSFLFDSTALTGRWRIAEMLPTGWTQTLPTTTDSFYDVTINDTNGDSYSVTRENYKTLSSFYFGSYDPSLSVSSVTPLAAPTSTPEAGTYTSVQFVSLSSASSSATTTRIYYTFAPDANPSCTGPYGTLFSSPIEIASSTTLQAIACSDASTSTVSSLVYTINLPPAEPTASPAAGSYSAAQNVELFSASTTASIYYTTDGTEPLCGIASLYASPLPLSSDTTLKAVACGGGATSTTATFSYDITIPAASSGDSGNKVYSTNGPPSDTIPVNAPPPPITTGSASGNGISSGNAVIPTPPPPTQGNVLGTQTHNLPTTAPLPTTTEAPTHPTPQITELPEPDALPAASAAAGFSLSWPEWAALIFVFLLLLWALWSWYANQEAS